MSYESFEQPLTDDRRAELLAWMPEPEPWFRGLETRLVGHGFACAIALAFFLVIMRDLSWQKDRLGPFVGLVALFCGYVLLMARGLVLRPLRKYRENKKRFLQFQDAVKKATVARVQRIRSDDVVEVWHDEGIICLFAIGSNRCFWVDAVGPPKKWPNTDFEMVRIAGWDEDLGPFCSGKALRRRQQLHFGDVFSESFDFDALPQDGVISLSVDDFLKSARPE